MLRPKLADPPTLPAQHGHAPACTCQHTSAPVLMPIASGRLAPNARIGTAVAVAGAVITVGVVLTALLVAVAVAAVSVAIAAVVLRSLLTKTNQR